MTGFHVSETAKKIMVLEDNCLTLSQLTDCLNEAGYAVIPCKQSAEARNLLNEITPDLIILDIIMPDVDGYEFCQWVRAQPRLKLVPIIFVTAKTSVEEKITGLKAGGDDYITKPFVMDELLARVQVILNRVESFHELSMRDDLTGAYNRRYFKERLEEEVHRVRRTARPFSVVLLDIDFFKKINDNFGHYVGDYILKELVRFLQNRLRKTDLIARVGGEEFVLLLPDTSSAQAYMLVERLRKSLEETVFAYRENGMCMEISFTVSAGLACCPEHDSTPEGLMRLADNALYNAKSLGRNNVKIADRS